MSFGMDAKSQSRIDHARALYRSIGEDFDRALLFHVERGYVIAAPDVLLIGRPVALYGPHDDAWWIEYLSGDIVTALEQMPFWLPFIVFGRKGRVKAYATAKIVNRVLKDGPTDEMSRWRWWRPDCTTTETANCGNG